MEMQCAANFIKQASKVAVKILQIERFRNINATQPAYSKKITQKAIAIQWSAPEPEMASICYLCEVVEPLGAPGPQIDDEAIIEEIVAPEEKEQLADQAESLLLMATTLAMKTVKLVARVLQQVLNIPPDKFLPLWLSHSTFGTTSWTATLP
jgi:hypothetical protein